MCSKFKQRRKGLDKKLSCQQILLAQWHLWKLHFKMFFSNLTKNQTDGNLLVTVFTITLSSLLGIFVAGLVLNFCVVMTILKTRSLKSSSVNLAVLSLIIADLMEVGLELPASVWIFSAKFWNIQVNSYFSWNVLFFYFFHFPLR